MTTGKIQKILALTNYIQPCEVLRFLTLEGGTDRGLFHESTGVTSDNLTDEGAVSDKHQNLFHEIFC